MAILVSRSNRLSYLRVSIDLERISLARSHYCAATNPFVLFNIPFLFNTVYSKYVYRPFRNGSVCVGLNFLEEHRGENNVSDTCLG